MGIGALERLMYAYTGANICQRQGTSTTSHIYPSVLQALAGRGSAGRLERGFLGYYAVLSRILQMDFVESINGEVRETAPSTTLVDSRREKLSDPVRGC